MDVVAAMLPFVLAGAFLPTFTAVVVALLGTRRPIANSLHFVGGNAAFRLSLGMVALFVFEIPNLTLPSETSGRATSTIVIALAVVALGWSLREYRRPDEEPAALERVLRRLHDVTPHSAFALGAALVASPGAQWVYFLGGLGVLSHARLPASVKVAGVFAYVAALQVMLVLPVVAYSRFGERSRTALASASEWLLARSGMLSALVLAVLGVYLLWFGITGLVSVS